MPNSFAESPDGTLYIADGFGPVLRWDGLTPSTETAGVSPPASALTLAASGAGSIKGSYYAYLRFVDRHGNFSNLSPVSAVLVTADSGAAAITFSGLTGSSDPKVTRRQILRNTAGQADTFYVDIDTTDLTSTSLSSTRIDTDLQTQQIQALFDSNGGILANRYTVPPDWKAILAHHLDRMFYLMDVEYTEGSVVLTFGSTTVAGIGTEWTASVASRFLWATGADKEYQIASVNTTTQTLTLALPYAGASDPYAAYAIRPARAERRLVYYSEAGLPEAVPAVNAFEIQEDGDTFTGGMAKGSFLYILERRHIYRFTFKSDPATDGFVFLSANRGCVNNRCWVVVDEDCYMLDEAGIHNFDGGQGAEPLSTPIQGIFHPEGANGIRVNWAASKFFHAVHFPAQETIRWFVALSGTYLPYHAIAYQYRLKRFWIEEFAVPIGSSALGLLNNQPQVFLGASARKVLAFWKGPLDGPDPSAGTVRGTVTSSTPTSLSDSLAIFATAGLVGSPLVIVSGRGKGQRRLISAVSGTTLQITQPWAILPDTTSVYQMGGIQWKYRTGWFRWTNDEQQNARRIEMLFLPCSAPATMDLDVFNDLSDSPITWQASYLSNEASGVASTAGDPDLVVDLTKASGFAQKRMDSRKDNYLDAPRFVSAQLAGVTNQDTQRIYQLLVDGAEK